MKILCQVQSSEKKKDINLRESAGKALASNAKARMESQGSDISKTLGKSKWRD